MASKPTDCDHCGVPLASADARYWCAACRGTMCDKCRDAIQGVGENRGCWVAERSKKKEAGKA